MLKSLRAQGAQDYPRGRKVAGADSRMFLGVGVPGSGQLPELALLSAAAWCGRLLRLPELIGHYNRQAPHSALEMRSPTEFYVDWMVKTEKRSVPN